MGREARSPGVPRVGSEAAPVGDDQGEEPELDTPLRGSLSAPPLGQHCTSACPCIARLSESLSDEQSYEAAWDRISRCQELRMELRMLLEGL